MTAWTQSVVRSAWGVLLCALLISGCGVPQEDFDEIEREIDILEAQLDEARLEEIGLEKVNVELTEEKLRLEEWVRELSVEKTALEEKIKLLEERLNQQAVPEASPPEPLNVQNMPSEDASLESQ